MSNFSEVYLRDFSAAKPLSQDDLLRFAVDHRWRNTAHHSLLSRGAAEEIVRRYFGVKLTRFRAFDRYRMVNGQIETNPEADGEEGYSSIVDGCWALAGNRFKLHTTDTGDMGSKSHHEAVVAKTSNGYILIEYRRA